LNNKDALISALKKEILLENDFFNVETNIDTVYFGGGTPSILATTDLDDLLHGIDQKYRIAHDAEITIEANPDDINADKLQSWLGMGINRLSLGVQSFLDHELSWMNRAHTSLESINSIDLILNAGMNNFSVDLIFGSPLLSDVDLEKNLALLIEKNIPHISCYALTVEQRTALHHSILKNKKNAIDTNKQADQFLLIMKILNSAGYEQYEISNYAKKGMRSKHNSNYWLGTPYIGIGPSAHSFDGNDVRRWNVSDNNTYIHHINNGAIPFEKEILTPTQQLNEYIMTSLRRIEGIDLDHITTKFGRDKANIILSICNREFFKNKVQLNKSKLCLTAEGKLMADGISAELFF